MPDRKPGRLPELSAGRPIPKLLENHPDYSCCPCAYWLHLALTATWVRGWTDAATNRMTDPKRF
jgi:hypothetical protein